MKSFVTVVLLSLLSAVVGVYAATELHAMEQSTRGSVADHGAAPIRVKPARDPVPRQQAGMAHDGAAASRQQSRDAYPHQ